jgi:hypothetical protein
MLKSERRLKKQFDQIREKIINRGYPERTSGIECGSGFQPRQLSSRLEAAPTESLSNGNLDFPDKQVINLST